MTFFLLFPELTTNDNEKNTLISLRFGFLILANITVYILASILLKEGSSSDSGEISSSDLHAFELMGIIVTIVGLIFSTIFHIGVRETKTEDDYIDEEEDDDNLLFDEIIVVS